MIEKKVGNVTLQFVAGSHVDALVGSVHIARQSADESRWRDFGPEVNAAIDDLLKPLAENECCGPEGERLRFELRDSDGVGVAREGNALRLVETDTARDSDSYIDVCAALRIWAEKERARWGTERSWGAAVDVTRDGKLDGYGWVDSKGWRDNSNSHLIPTWVRTKAQAEYEAMVREKKPKKPSERLKAPIDGVDRELWDKMLFVLDEIAEKVGGL